MTYGDDILLSGDHEEEEQAKVNHVPDKLLCVVLMVTVEGSKPEHALYSKCILIEGVTSFDVSKLSTLRWTRGWTR